MFNDLFNVPQGMIASQALDPAQAEELQKTMVASHGYLGAPTQLTGGPALQLESIDGTLKSVTYEAKDLVFWPSVPQDRAYSLVEQYVRTNSYGDAGSPYIPEAGSPAMNDSEYNRHAQKVVFFATRRGVSIASTMVRQNFGGDLEGRESQSGTLWMLERLERELYKGLADFSSAGEFDGSNSAIPVKLQNLNLSGFEVQVRQGDADYAAQARAFDGYGGAKSVLADLRGGLITEGVIEDGANVVRENFGHASELHLEPKNMSDFIKQFYPKERVNVLGIADGRAGYIVKTMTTTAGDIALRPNIFMKAKDAPKSQMDRAGVPGAPASASVSLTAGSTDFSNGDVYNYVVTAVNEQGESASQATATANIDADGKYVDISIGSPSGGPVPTHYAVYRSEGADGSGARKFIGYVARSGSTTHFLDKNAKLPGQGTGYLMDFRSEVMVWKQLAPLMKLNLAQVTMAKEFILWLAGCLILFAPRKQYVLQNIGKAVG